jgi:hypothetical protein
MTIRSAAALAVARDAGPRRAEPLAPDGPPPTPAATPAAGEPVAAVPDAGASALAAVVPTDVAAFYTTVLGVLAGILVESPGASYQPLRWWLYAGGLMATLLAVPIAYRAAARSGSKKRRLPVVETVTAVFAFAVWGLVVPTSPLYFVLQAPVLPIAVAILSAAGAMVLTAMLSPLLEKPAAP